MPETTYYEQGSVLVTSSRFVVSGQTYPLGQISSVGLKVVPKKTGCGILLMIVGSLVGALLTLSALGGDLSILLIAGFFFLVAAGGFALNKSAQDRYAVEVMTAGGQQRLLINVDRAIPEAVVAALNDALVARDSA